MTFRKPFNDRFAEKTDMKCLLGDKNGKLLNVFNSLVLFLETLTVASESYESLTPRLCKVVFVKKGSNSKPKIWVR